MSATLMAASCDSIGSCSLDVDAESIADSLIDSAQVDSSPNHRKSGEHQANAPSLSEQTLHSLLLSASSSSGGLHKDIVDKSQCNLSTPSPSTAKKPSYLNLACSISGYGGITTYDSKLREGFRSRDQSPGKLIGIQNGSREASPARGIGASSTSTTSANFLSATNAGRFCWTPSPVSGHLTGKHDMKHSAHRFNGTNGTDQTDATGNFYGKQISDQRNRWLESTLSPSEQAKDYQNVVSVFETKTARCGLTAETSVDERYKVTSMSQSTTISSTTVVSSGTLPTEYLRSSGAERIIPISVEGNSTSDVYTGKQVYTNGSSSQPISSKSFIQQRVERLYGPGALAQGFFHRSSKCIEAPTSHSICPKIHDSNGAIGHVRFEQKSSTFSKEESPELPVLRHLRPEFRDQLTVAPRRSLGSRFSNGCPPSNLFALQSPSGNVDSVKTPALIQQETSTESIADLQPAAAEVILPQQSSNAPLMEKLEPLVCEHDSGPKVLTFKDSVTLPESIEMKPSASVLSVSSKVTDKETKEENAGHKFLKIQRQTIETLLELAQKAEQDIEESGKNDKVALSEEALGHLRAAAGQARLLVTQKMVQFEGLCHKCIIQSTDEPFPTTAEDLQGFWDMLLLQVEQVHSTFQRLDKLRDAGWCEEKLSSEDNQKAIDSPGLRASFATNKRVSRTSKNATPSSSKSAEATALRKQREEERRKLMEQRRRELKQQADKGGDASIESVKIYGAQPS